MIRTTYSGFVADFVAIGSSLFSFISHLGRGNGGLQTGKNGSSHFPAKLSGSSRTSPDGLTERFWGVEEQSITRAFERALSRARAVYEKECKEKSEKADSALLNDLPFHDLRLEATSCFFEKGFNVIEVAAITGHKTLQMLKRYTHLKAEELAERMK